MPPHTKLNICKTYDSKKIRLTKIDSRIEHLGQKLLLRKESSTVFWFLWGFFGLLRGTPVAYEVPRLGVELEQQLPAYTAATATQDPTMSATYTAAHSNAGSVTH